MAPNTLPLPTTASKVARKGTVAEILLEFFMFVFLGLFVYFSIRFTLISLGSLVEVTQLHLAAFGHQLLPFWAELPSLADPAINTAAFGLAALGVYTDLKTLLLPLIVRHFTFLYAAAYLVTMTITEQVSHALVVVAVVHGAGLALCLLTTIVMATADHRILCTIPVTAAKKYAKVAVKGTKVEAPTSPAATL